MTDLEYMGKAIRHGNHAERVAALIRSSLEGVGYRVGGNGFVVAPAKVCKLVSDLGVKMVELLDEVDPSKVSG